MKLKWRHSVSQVVYMAVCKTKRLFWLSTSANCHSKRNFWARVWTCGPESHEYEAPIPRLIGYSKKK